MRNSPPDGAEVRCAEHQIRVRCPALELNLNLAGVLLKHPINLGSSLSKAKKYRNPSALKVEKVQTFGLN